MSALSAVDGDVERRGIWVGVPTFVPRQDSPQDLLEHRNGAALPGDAEQYPAISTATPYPPVYESMWWQCIPRGVGGEGGGRGYIHVGHGVLVALCTPPPCR